MSLLTDLDASSTEHMRCGDLDGGVDGDIVWMAFLAELDVFCLEPRRFNPLNEMVGSLGGGLRADPGRKDYRGRPPPGRAR